MSERSLVWLPYADAVDRMGGVPDGIEVEAYDGSGPAPESATNVEFWVPPYLGAGPVVARLAGQLPRLRVVQTLTAGFDDVRAHLPSGVTLCNARGVHDASTAELAVGLMIAAQRGIDEFARAQPAGRWVAGRRPALADKTVLIVGYGAVGAAVERRLTGFEVDLLRVARTARDGPPSVAGMANLPELLPGSDIVVLTVPLTDATRGMVDRAFLARMKDGALVVNVARGPIVDTEALLAEVSAARLRAALDVTEPEPLPPDHPLWRAPGVLISPHVGGNTDAFLPRAYRLLADQLRRFAAGEPLANVITRDY
jgi:phosphoglycerate dehydrogenase-like enzyme